MWQWTPIPEPVLWDIQQAAAKTAIVALFWAGWAVLLASTYLINHFEQSGTGRHALSVARQARALKSGRVGFEARNSI